MTVETQLPPAPETQAAPVRRRTFTILLVAGTIAAAYGMIYLDVLARAREAFAQGAEHARRHENPDLKKQALEKKFAAEKAVLDRKLEKGKLSAEDHRQELEVLEFDREQALADSSIKYAYQWYKDTYELFSPPESRWVRRARFLAPAAKERWREELRAKTVPFEEYMLDLEAGEDAGTLMVYSTRSPDEARKCVELLSGAGIEARVFDAPAEGRLPQEGLKIIVPRARFWDAHEALKAVAPPPLPVESGPRN